MDDKILHIKMLGEFSLQYGEARVSDADNRSYKVWLLLAYLIYNRNRFVPRDELIRLLGDSERNVNPTGALKTVLWRVRKTLEPLDCGELILNRSGGYGWNGDVPVALDLEEFAALCKEAEGQEEGRLETLRRAVALYRGDFLSKLAGEQWVEPIAAYFHNIYIAAVTELLPLMDQAGESREAVNLCREALTLSPYEEPLYRQLMRSLMALEDYEAAAAVYEDLRSLLFDELNVIPDEESQLLYQEVVRFVGNQSLPPDIIRSQLREQNFAAGAMICDYATFKLFYQAEARSAARRGDAIHIGVLSAVSKDGEPLSSRSLKHAMEQLMREVQRNLRTGDVASQCSASQYILMLIQANFENSEMVCNRVAQAFARAHPRSPAKIEAVVLPLEPAFGNS